MVYGAISGFGNYGPLHERPGYDIIAQTMSGLMSLTGEEGGGPLPALSIRQSSRRSSRIGPRTTPSRRKSTSFSAPAFPLLLSTTLRPLWITTTLHKHARCSSTATTPSPVTSSSTATPSSSWMTCPSLSGQLPSSARTMPISTAATA